MLQAFTRFFSSSLQPFGYIVTTFANVKTTKMNDSVEAHQRHSIVCQ